MSIISGNNRRLFETVTIITKLKRFIKNENDAFLYAYEGFMIAFTLQLFAYANNLFASRLGATDMQLSLIQLAPMALCAVILVPAGLFIDSMKNKRRMVTRAILLAAISFLAVSFSPLFGDLRFEVFIIFLALAYAGMNVFNISWQAYFPEVIPIEKRNRTLTIRSYVTFMLATLMPLIAGFLLAKMNTNDDKIMMHRIFYILGFIMLIWQSIVFLKIKAKNPVTPRKMDIKGFMASIKTIANKQYVVFLAAIIFIYMTWQMDWTLYYIGQTKYLGMNEAFLSYTVVVGAVTQFATLRFWSKVNEKLGVVLPITFAVLGLSIAPIAMLVGTSLSGNTAKFVFLFCHMLANIPFAIIPLNVFQCLLQVVDEKQRTFGLSIFSVLTSLSNATMPVIGVYIYTRLGSDLSALRITFFIIFILRILATCLWLLRYLVIRKNEKLLKKPA